MIKVYVNNSEGIEEWYCNHLLPNLFSRKELLIQYLEDNRSDFQNHKKLINRIINIIRDLSMLDLKNILLKTFDWLKKNYNFINFYIYLTNKYLTKNTKHIEPKDKLIRYINSAIEKMFNYDFINDEVKQNLVSKLDIRVCPYCNRQFIQPLTISGNKRYICDLDHIKPKLKYPLFSMSLWNLLPSCKPCNQSFKNQRDTEILSPYFSGFHEEGIVFKINYKDLKSIVGLSENMDYKWEYFNGIISDKSEESDKLKLCENNITLFHLNEVYATNKKEIKNVLKKRYKLSKSYEQSLFNIRNLNALIELKTYYGVSLDPREFQNEMMSKAIYDVIHLN